MNELLQLHCWNEVLKSELLSWEVWNLPSWAKRSSFSTEGSMRSFQSFTECKPSQVGGGWWWAWSPWLLFASVWEFCISATWPSVQTRFLGLCSLCMVSLGAVVGTEHFSGAMARPRNAQGKKCFRKCVWSDSLSSKHRYWAERVLLKACTYERVVTVTCPVRNCFALLVRQTMEVLDIFNLICFLSVHSFKYSPSCVHLVPHQLIVLVDSTGLVEGTAFFQESVLPEEGETFCG